MNAEALIDAFGAEIGVRISDDTRFGSPNLGVQGTSDGNRGVQWNTWLDLKENVAYLGINLEGMKYDDWPVARFIEREFRYPRLFDVVGQLVRPELVQVMWYRDAWQGASRPPIKENQIGISGRMLSDVGRDDWHATLRDAYDCLDASKGYRGRGKQVVTVKRGRVEHQVSPHLQFRQRLAQAPQRIAWTDELRIVRSALEPLHRFVASQAKP